MSLVYAPMYLFLRCNRRCPAWIMNLSWHLLFKLAHACSRYTVVYVRTLLYCGKLWNRIYTAVLYDTAIGYAVLVVHCTDIVYGALALG